MSKDKVFGLYSKCPNCGSKKIHYKMQYPVIFDVALNKKIIWCIDKDGKRLMATSNFRKASIFINALNSNEYQMAQLICEDCGEVGDTLTP